MSREEERKEGEERGGKRKGREGRMEREKSTKGKENVN